MDWITFHYVQLIHRYFIKFGIRLFVSWRTQKHHKTSTDRTDTEQQNWTDMQRSKLRFDCNARGTNKNHGNLQSEYPVSGQKYEVRNLEY